MKSTPSKIMIPSALAIIVFLVCAFSNQNEEKKYLTLRTIEAAAWDSRMIIVNEHGETKELELEKFKPSNFAANTKRINEELNKIAARGYELIAVSGSDLQSSTYTFLKR
jgi:hypothetical protein